MPVEDIHTERCHNIEILFYLFFPEEVTAFVQHEPSPFVTGLVFDPAGFQGTVAKTYQLQQGFFGMEQTRLGRSFQ